MNHMDSVARRGGDPDADLCPRCLGRLGEGAPSRRYQDLLEVLICRPCRQEQELNAHGLLGPRAPGAAMVRPSAEEWPISPEEQFVARSHDDARTPTALSEQPTQGDEVDDDMSDREYLQADDEAIGEEHTEMLKRLGLTQDEWDDGMR